MDFYFASRLNSDTIYYKDLNFDIIKMITTLLKHKQQAVETAIYG